MVLGSDGKTGVLTFANTATLLPCMADPPVQKKINGSPARASSFVFVLTRNDPAYPMPEGSVNGRKEMTIVGAQKKDFGFITFTESGTYLYTVTEKNTGETGYTYDPAVYTIRFVVTDNNGQLEAERTFLKDGVEQPEMTSAEFTNTYKAPDKGKTPSTGDDARPGLWLGLMGASAVGMGAFGRRRKENA